jgi:hypothetical protein
MAGYVNSWIEQYQAGTTPCIQDTLEPETSANNWLLWVIVGVILGSLQFEKRS